MKLVAIRVDASLEIGTGHVMRCLTLANALRERGCECHFISRAHQGHLNDLVDACGFRVFCLPVGENKSSALGQEQSVLKHAKWLGVDWRADVAQVRASIGSLFYDWIVVDHYALDARWERELHAACHKLMVIDDLADRYHVCNVLLDQNFGKDQVSYIDLVPDDCELLIGPKYALLRPEFFQARKYSLSRRRGEFRLKELMVFLGGVDENNVTGKILNNLKDCALPDLCKINVIMGSKSLWLDEVRSIAAAMPWTTSVFVNVSNISQYYANCDLSIGAVGGAAWERCCLGVPSLMVVLADNQQCGAMSLHNANAGYLLGSCSDLHVLKDIMVQLTGADYRRMGENASMLTDGRGVQLVADRLSGMQ